MNLLQIISSRGSRAGGDAASGLAPLCSLALVRNVRFRSGGRSVAVVALIAASLLLGPHPACAKGRFDDLLVRVPRSANALMLIDVGAVHRSPLAVKEDWKGQHAASYANKPMILPPESDRMVLASQMNPNRGFATLWEGAVISLRAPLSPRAVARAEGGYVDEIRGLPAVWTPSDAYVVLFDSKLMGILTPAHRQAVARWVEYTETPPGVAVSDYLQQAADRLDGRTTQIVLAVDLQDAVQPQRLQEALDASPLVGNDEAKKRQWGRLVSGIRGVTLAVQIGESARGVLRVDFSKSTAPFGKEAKALVLDALAKYGVGLDDFDQWKARLDNQSIVLQGSLSTRAMRKVFSLLELPTTDFTSARSRAGQSGETTPPDRTPPQTSQDPAQAAVKASQTYFKSVTTLLDDLEEEFRTNRDARRTMAATFMERYARRIDRLPILNVDEELLEFGAKVAETLRSTSIASRQAGVRTGVRKARAAGYSTYYYGYGSRYAYGDGYYGTRTRSAQSSEIQREEAAKGRQVRFANWKAIQDARAGIRAKMTQKYNVPF